MLTKDVGARPTLTQLLASEGPLREAVEAVERDIAWPESLVPPLAASPEAAGGGGWQPSLPAIRSGALSINVDEGEVQSSPQAAAPPAASPSTEPLRRGGGRLAPPLQGSPGGAAAEPYGTRPSSTSSSRSMAAFAVGAAERLKAGSSVCSESPLQEPPPLPPESEGDGELPPRPFGEEAPPWLRFCTGDLGGPGAESDEAAVREASQIQDLLELTVRRHELEAMVERVLGTQEEDSPLPTPATASEVHAGPLAPPGMPPCPGGGPAQEPRPQTAPAWAEGAGGSGGQGEEAAAGSEQATQLEAARLGARLRCVEALQTEEPDPVELTDTLLDMKEMDLAGEDCGQAVLAHAHRLSMKAEDTVKLEDAPVPAMERAVELLEAVKSDVRSAQRALESAGSRLLNAHELRRQVGLRCISGNHARILSVWRSASVGEVHAQVAAKFLRPKHGLDLRWNLCGSGYPLCTEEDWQQCLAAYPRGPIELHLAPEPPGRSASSQKRGCKRHSLAHLASSGTGLKKSLPTPHLRSHALQGVAGAMLSGSAVPTAMQRPKASPAGRRRAASVLS